MSSGLDIVGIEVDLLLSSVEPVAIRKQSHVPGPPENPSAVRNILKLPPESGQDVGAGETFSPVLRPSATAEQRELES
jgi:hypothetical protein